MELVIENTDIKGTRGGFYVIQRASEGSPHRNKYLHRNGTLHKDCGRNNFYISQEEAQDVIDLYNGYKDLDKFLISEEEFQV